MLVRPGHISMEFMDMFPLCNSKALSKPFPAPSKTMSMKIPQATANPVRAVRSLLRFNVPIIS
jgi:hypothetical protein